MVMQCVYRIHLAKRKTILQRKMHFVKEMMDHWRIREADLQTRIRRNGAATYIIKRYRAYMTTKKMKKMLYWHHFSMATVIQAYYRRWYSQSMYQVLNYNRVQRYKLENKSATLIQKCVRAFVARSKYDKVQ